jgi:hypothetical protein
MYMICRNHPTRLPSHSPPSVESLSKYGEYASAAVGGLHRPPWIDIGRFEESREDEPPLWDEVRECECVSE